jgi:hypothetical protein
VRQWRLVACTVLWGGLGLGTAQENGHMPVSVVEDWSSRHVIFAEEVPREYRGAVLAEPRFWQQYYRRHANRPLASGEEREDEHGRDRDSDDRHKKRKKTLSHRDWSVPLDRP